MQEKWKKLREQGLIAFKLMLDQATALLAEDNTVDFDTLRSYLEELEVNLKQINQVVLGKIVKRHELHEEKWVEVLIEGEVFDSYLREIINHGTQEERSPYCIEVWDFPNERGGHHHYSISGYDASDNPSYQDGASSSPHVVRLYFQNGKPNADGLNGITDETLLAILIDRAKRDTGDSAENLIRRMAGERIERALMLLKGIRRTN